MPQGLAAAPLVPPWSKTTCCQEGRGEASLTFRGADLNLQAVGHPLRLLLKVLQILLFSVLFISLFILQILFTREVLNLRGLAKEVQWA